MSMVMVIGPTPPGTGVMEPAISLAASKSTSPRRMAMGLPVVAYDTQVSREYLGSLGLYAAPMGDVPALAQTLALVLRNPVLGQELGVQLRERARKHFSWDRTGKQLLRVYEKVLEKK